MASRGRGRRGRPRGTGQAPPAFDQPPVFDQQAFVEAVGIAVAAIAQAGIAGCDAPKPGGPLTTSQPPENLYVSYHETHTRVKMASWAHKPILTK